MNEGRSCIFHIDVAPVRIHQCLSAVRILVLNNSVFLVCISCASILSDSNREERAAGFWGEYKKLVDPTAESMSGDRKSLLENRSGGAGENLSRISESSKTKE